MSTRQAHRVYSTACGDARGGGLGMRLG